MDVKVQLEALVDGLKMLEGSIWLLDVAGWDVGLVVDVGLILSESNAGNFIVEIIFIQLQFFQDALVIALFTA